MYKPGVQQKDGWVVLIWMCTSKGEVIEWSSWKEERQCLVNIAWEEQPGCSSCSCWFHSTSAKCLHSPNREKHSSYSVLPMLFDDIYTSQDIWVISLYSLVLWGKVWGVIFVVGCFSSHFPHNCVKWVGLREHNWPKVTQMVYHA